jgi:hypothetical protein
VKPYLKKFFTKIGLVEWLKVKALNSSPSTAKKKKIKNLALGFFYYRKPSLEPPLRLVPTF